MTVRARFKCASATTTNMYDIKVVNYNSINSNTAMQ